jgi:hypothetical protein
MLLGLLKLKDAILAGVQEWWVGMKRKDDDPTQWIWTDSSPVNESYM